jgi:hypothetical protein
MGEGKGVPIPLKCIDNIRYSALLHSLLQRFRLVIFRGSGTGFFPLASGDKCNKKEKYEKEILHWQKLLSFIYSSNMKEYPWGHLADMKKVVKFVQREK